MKAELKIGVVNFNFFSSELEKVDSHHDFDKTENHSELGVYSKRTVVDGVYIFTESGMFISPNIWGTVKGETPIGVAVVEGDKRRIVALNSSKEPLQWLEKSKSVSGEEFNNRDEAKSDWDGRKYMDKLLKAGNPAAKYCNEYACGTISAGNWYLPSLGELVFLQKHKNMIDACLTLCGGEPLHCGWHWSSTEYSSGSAWCLYWVDGGTYGSLKDYIDQVRPVSAF